VLRFGPEAEALKPASPRREVAEDLAAALRANRRPPRA
jgi:hypothetical protein